MGDFLGRLIDVRGGPKVYIAAKRMFVLMVCRSQFGPTGLYYKDFRMFDSVLESHYH